MLILVADNWETDSVAMVRLISVIKVAGKVWSGRGVYLRDVFPAFAAVVITSGENISLSSCSGSKNDLKWRLGV